MLDANFSWLEIRALSCLLSLVSPSTLNLLQLAPAIHLWLPALSGGRRSYLSLRPYMLAVPSFLQSMVEKAPLLLCICPSFWDLEISSLPSAQQLTNQKPFGELCLSVRTSPDSYLQPLTLKVYLCPLLHKFLSLGGNVISIPFRLSMLKSIILCMWRSCGSSCYLPFTTRNSVYEG